jgi:hypothetical protein
MERATLSQVAQTECFAVEVTHENGDHSDQPFLCGFVRLHQTQRQHQTQSLCSQIKIVRTRYPIRLRCSSETQSRSIGCVR